MLAQLLPPELNSLFIVTGPGSGPLWAAAEAWDGLAAELETTATGFGSVVGGLGADWAGKSSAVAQTKLDSYVAWLHQAAARALQAGQFAKMHAGFYEEARNTLVPLEAVLENRVRFVSLCSTNILGQNTPMIAECEAEYVMYWATDVMGMLSYEAKSRAIDLKESFVPPQTGPSTASVAPQLLSAGVPGTSDATSLLGGGFNLGNIFGGLGEGAAGLGWGELLNPANLLTPEGLAQAGNFAAMPTRLMMSPASMLIRLARGGSSATGLGQNMIGGGTSSLLDAINEMVSGKLQGLTSGLSNQLSSWGQQIGQQVSAQLANASRIGGLSVPEGAIQTITRALPVPPATTVVSPATVQAGMPGGPFAQAMMGALAGRGFGGLGSVAKAGAKAATSAKGG